MSGPRRRAGCNRVDDHDSEAVSKRAISTQLGTAAETLCRRSIIRGRFGHDQSIVVQPSRLGGPLAV